MKVKCLHGFFIFEETRVGQVSDFISLTGFDIVPWRDRFTFATLENAPDFSIAGLSLLGTTAVATFAGEPWHVFEANDFVYDFSTDLIVPITSIAIKTKIQEAGDHYIAPGLIQPGSLTSTGKRVKNFSAFFSRERLSWRYSEVTYV